MNNVKYRPVGQDEPIVKIKVTQKRVVIQGIARSKLKSLYQTNQQMSHRGFVRVKH